MTVLQQAIGFILLNAEKTAEDRMTTGDIINYLESLLPAEEQQVKNAWEAGANRYHNDQYGPIPNPHPDLETYITNLKEKK